MIRYGNIPYRTGRRRLGRPFLRQSRTRKSSLTSIILHNYSERKNYFHFAESLFFKIESRYISKVQIFMSFAIHSQTHWFDRIFVFRETTKKCVFRIIRHPSCLRTVCFASRYLFIVRFFLYFIIILDF